MKKMYEELIGRKSGDYVFTDKKEMFEQLLLKENLPIDGLEHIKVGDKTDLYGWFVEPVIYMGILSKNNNRAMVFLLGEDSIIDLFERKKYTYYDLTHIIGKRNDRIGKCYKPGTFRDAFLKKDKNNNYYWN